MPNKIIIDVLGQRVAALLNAVEKDIPHQKKWLSYLFETMRRNSSPSGDADTPFSFTDRYGRAGMDFSPKSLAVLTCIQRGSDGKAHVLYTPRMRDCVMSVFRKEETPECSLSEATLDDGSVEHYLDGPTKDVKFYLDYLVAADRRAVSSLLKMDSPPTRVKLRVDPKIIERLKGNAWHTLQLYEHEEHRDDGYAAMIVPAFAAEDVLGGLGHMGALPSREEQIERFVEDVRSQGNIRSLCLTMLDFINESIVITEELASPIDITQEKIIKLLTDKLETHSLDDGSIEQRSFYYLLIRRLMVSLADVKVDESVDSIVTSQRTLALARMHTLLQSMDHMNYGDFLTSVHMCLDEIMLLMSVTSHAPSAEALASIHEQTHLSLSRFVQENCFGKKPNDVTMTSSGMQACHLALMTAITEISKKRGHARVHINEYTYFEITPPFTMSEKKIFLGNGQTYFMDGKTRFDVSSDDIMDIWVGGFESNVYLKKTAPQYVDISSVIKRQFELRATGWEDDSPFIVIVDNTMSHFNEVYFPLLLAEYAEEIQYGKLALISAYSLNKFFNMGQDNTPAGLLSTFYKKENFPTLVAMHDDPSTGVIGGFSIMGQTIRYIDAVIKHGSDLIDLFQSRLQDRTRLLYERCLPKTLTAAPHPITIDSPRLSATFSVDDLDTKRCADLSNDWNFINIRLNVSQYNLPYEVEICIFERLIDFFRTCNTYRRSGFGFAETTYDQLEEGRLEPWAASSVCVVRLLIGTEDLGEQKACITALGNYLVSINNVLESALHKRGVQEKGQWSFTEREESSNFLANRIEGISISTLETAKLASSHGLFSGSTSSARTCPSKTQSHITESRSCETGSLG